MAHSRKNTEDLGETLTGGVGGPIVVADAENTPPTHEVPPADLLTPPTSAAEESPKPRRGRAKAAEPKHNEKPVEAVTDPADLYADAVARHGKDSSEARAVREQHGHEPAFLSVADWIDRQPVGIVRAGTEKPADAPKGAGRQAYRVGHQDCPTHEVEASHPLEAIEAYKEWAGIRQTPHSFSVEEA